MARKPIGQVEADEKAANKLVTCKLHEADIADLKADVKECMADRKDLRKMIADLEKEVLKVVTKVGVAGLFLGGLGTFILGKVWK